MPSLPDQVMDSRPLHRAEVPEDGLEDYAEGMAGVVGPKPLLRFQSNNRYPQGNRKPGTYPINQAALSLRYDGYIPPRGNSISFGI